MTDNSTNLKKELIIFNYNYQLSNFVQDTMYPRVKERHATPRPEIELV